MGLQEEYEERTHKDYNYKEELESLPHKKRVKRMLEDRLERKRLRDEFKDDFDEYLGEFDWDEIEK